MVILLVCNSSLPIIERSVHGVVVPMPIFPRGEIKIEEVACELPLLSPTKKLPAVRELPVKDEIGVKPKIDDEAT